MTVYDLSYEKNIKYKKKKKISPWIYCMNIFLIVLCVDFAWFVDFCMCWKKEEESSEETDSESDMDEDDKRARAQKKDHDDHERKIDEQLKRLKSLENENDLLLEEEGWNGTSNGMTSVRKKSDERGKILSPKEPVRRSLTEYSLRTAEDGKCGKLKSFFEEKVEGHVNGDHNELSRSLNFSKKSVSYLYERSYNRININKHYLCQGTSFFIDP